MQSSKKGRKHHSYGKKCCGFVCLSYAFVSITDRCTFSLIIVMDRAPNSNGIPNKFANVLRALFLSGIVVVINPKNVFIPSN